MRILLWVLAGIGLLIALFGGPLMLIGFALMIGAMFADRWAIKFKKQTNEDHNELLRLRRRMACEPEPMPPLEAVGELKKQFRKGLKG